MAIGSIIAGGVAVGEAVGFSPTDIFKGARPRAGGADPCASGFEGVIVRNASQNGAPPDFRDLPPCPDASVPCGGGREVPGLGRVSSFANKDDAVDCIPQPSGGRFWRLDSNSHSWVDVSPKGIAPAVGFDPNFASVATPGAESPERLAVQAGVFGSPAVNPMVALLLLGGVIVIGVIFAQRSA